MRTFMSREDVTIRSRASAATSASGSVDATQTSGPYSPSPRGVATVAPSSPSPVTSRSRAARTCASIAATPAPSTMPMPAIPGVDVRHRRRAGVEAAGVGAGE